MNRPNTTSHHYAIFAAHYPPRLGGIPHFAESLAHTLASLDQRVTVFTNNLDKGPAYKRINENLEIVYLPSFNLLKGRLPITRKNKELRYLMSRFFTQSIDRVLINARFYNLSLIAVQEARQHNLTPVILEHGSNYLTFNNALLDYFDHIYERHFAKKELKGGARFAGVSKKAASWLREFGIYTPYVIHNSLDTTQFKESRSSRKFREELNLSDSDFLVVHNGRLLKDKGTSLVIEAALRNPSIQFVLSGDGPLAPYVREKSDEVDNFHYVGRLSTEDVSALLSTANLFLLPSRTEGMPTVLLEARAWNVPCAVSRVGGVEDMFADNDGLYVIESSASSIDEAIAQAINDFKGGKSVEFSSDFTWEHAVKELDEVFDDIEAAGDYDKGTNPVSKKGITFPPSSNSNSKAREYYINEVVPSLQEELLKLLDVFSKVARQLELPFWIDGGTLLGLERHNGFIPWDDDVDVGMPLDAWKEFCKKAPSLLPKGYKLKTMENTPNFPLFWAILVNENTTFITHEQLQAGYASGLFLDIFPFEPLENASYKAKRQCFRLSFWQKNSYLKEIGSFGGTGPCLTGILSILHAFIKRFVPKRYIAKRFWEAAATKQNSDKWIDLAYPDYGVFDESLIFPLKSENLLGVPIFVPNQTSRYLTEMYGNWEQLPEKDEIHLHFPLYINLTMGIGE